MNTLLSPSSLTHELTVIENGDLRNPQHKKIFITKEQADAVMKMIRSSDTHITLGGSSQAFPKVGALVRTLSDGELKKAQAKENFTSAYDREKWVEKFFSENPDREEEYLERSREYLIKKGLVTRQKFRDEYPLYHAEHKHFARQFAIEDKFS